jgi:hypothetical protein
MEGEHAGQVGTLQLGEKSLSEHHVSEHPGEHLGERKLAVGEHHLGDLYKARDFTSTGHIHTELASGPYRGLERPLKERVAADFERAAVQLKAEQSKDIAFLKADEIEKAADLKAEHAMTEGGTGFLAKLMGTEDPVKRAERKQLKAEIRRAKQALKADHAYETAELQAKKSKEKAALAAAGKLRHSPENVVHTPEAGVHAYGMPVVQPNTAVYQEPQPQMVPQMVVQQPVLQAPEQPVIQPATWR